jgi:hypothetical protein
MAVMLGANGGNWRFGSALALAICAQMLTGCSSSSSSAARQIPVDPGPYPNFSRPLSSAMEQMSDEDAKKQDAQLTALAGQRRSGAISQAEYQRRVDEMRKLAKPDPAPAPATPPVAPKT